MTAIAMITVVLIIVCSISGAAMPYVKGEKMFKFIRYLVEVITSAAAGFIVFLLLRVTDIPGEWIAAFSGISAYFRNSDYERVVRAIDRTTKSYVSQRQQKGRQLWKLDNSLTA